MSSRRISGSIDPCKALKYLGNFEKQLEKDPLLTRENNL